jgi:hypothetical protein
MLLDQDPDSKVCINRPTGEPVRLLVTSLHVRIEPEKLMHCGNRSPIVIVDLLNGTAVQRTLGWADQLPSNKIGMRFPTA